MEEELANIYAFAQGEIGLEERGWKETPHYSFDRDMQCYEHPTLTKGKPDEIEAENIQLRADVLTILARLDSAKSDGRREGIEEVFAKFKEVADASIQEDGDSMVDVMLKGIVRTTLEKTAQLVSDALLTTDTPKDTTL